MGGGRVPRSFGPAVHGSAPNDLHQLGYLGIAIAASGEKYVLILRDDHRNSSWLFLFLNTLTKNAARAIID